MAENSLTEAIENLDENLRRQGREEQKIVRVYEDGFSLSFAHGILVYRTSSLIQNLADYLVSQEEEHKKYLEIIKKAEFDARDSLRRQNTWLTKMVWRLVGSRNIPEGLIQDGETRISYDKLFLECANQGNNFFNGMFDLEAVDLGEYHGSIFEQYQNSEIAISVRDSLISITGEISLLCSSMLEANLRKLNLFRQRYSS